MDKYPLTIDSLELLNNNLVEYFGIFIKNKPFNLRIEPLKESSDWVEDCVVFEVVELGINIVIGRVLARYGVIKPDYGMIQSIGEFIEAVENNKSGKIAEIYIAKDYDERGDTGTKVLGVTLRDGDKVVMRSIYLNRLIGVVVKWE